jgi:hypothetical protein
LSDSNYQPTPIDVSRVELPGKLEDLVERLARNTHEVWARHRIQQGWRYGPARSDERKEHPCLVSYDDLPDSETDIDRHTVTAMLKAILALGFQIKPLDD